MRVRNRLFETVARSVLRGMKRRIRLIADDYGLAPGVSAAILDLLDRGRLTGTSCMTGFAQWAQEAERIKPLCGRVAVGLHLTLTDQPAVTGRSSQIRPPMYARSVRCA